VISIRKGETIETLVASGEENFVFLVNKLRGINIPLIWYLNVSRKNGVSINVFIQGCGRLLTRKFILAQIIAHCIAIMEELEVE